MSKNSGNDVTGLGKAYEGLVVIVVELGTSPEWDPMARRPREIIARVALNDLEQTDTDPQINRGDVLSKHERAQDGSNTQDQCLEWVGILTRERIWS